MLNPLSYNANAVIPHDYVVIWDAKYRASGKGYPRFPIKKMPRWLNEAQLALNNPQPKQAGTLSRSKLSHINGALGELNGYYLMTVQEGHFGILAPGNTTAGGVDFMTYLPPAGFTGNPLHAARTAFANGRVIGRIFRWPVSVVSL